MKSEINVVYHQIAKLLAEQLFDEELLLALIPPHL